ncbi:MAG: LPS export ABC transporter periplasmic protein LptC [Lewinellaceae bacterium]|nr:LPS export ABC transporter periplasmic protein LptC [Saprospiraceae bacterium]MCB9345479.1 LPS export ABC transporter periplasmic protein LptC [Lewinellaceae bacterium]
MNRGLFHMMLLGILLSLFACDDKDKELRQIFTEDDVAIEVAHDVEILYSDSAIVRVRVTGPLLYNYTDRENARQEFPQGIRMDFMQADFSVRSTLTARNAIRRQDKGLITARDSVVLTTIKEEKLETEELIWDEKSGKVYTEKFVKVTQPGEVIYGFGLEAEQDFSYWRILVPKGRIKVNQLNELK